MIFKGGILGGVRKFHMDSYLNGTTVPFDIYIYIYIYIYLTQNSQAVKKVCGPQKGYGEKRCEIRGGGQEMAVMVG